MLTFMRVGDGGVDFERFGEGIGRYDFGAGVE